MKKVFWAVFHNCFVHPLMGLFDLFTLCSWCPAWLDALHEDTGRQAFGDKP